MKNDTNPTPNAQAESKPLTLGAIERQLLDAELNEVSRRIRSGLTQVTEAVKSLSRTWHGQSLQPLYDLIARNMEYGVNAGEIEKVLPVAVKTGLVADLCKSFLAKVAEIENIAHEAAQRAEDAHRE